MAKQLTIVLAAYSSPREYCNGETANYRVSIKAGDTWVNTGLEYETEREADAACTAMYLALTSTGNRVRTIREEWR